MARIDKALSDLGEARRQVENTIAAIEAAATPQETVITITPADTATDVADEAGLQPHELIKRGLYTPRPVARPAPLRPHPPVARGERVLDLPEPGPGQPAIKPNAGRVLDMAQDEESSIDRRAEADPIGDAEGGVGIAPRGFLAGPPTITVFERIQLGRTGLTPRHRSIVTTAAETIDKVHTVPETLAPLVVDSETFGPGNTAGIDSYETMECVERFGLHLRDQVLSDAAMAAVHSTIRESEAYQGILHYTGSGSILRPVTDTDQEIAHQLLDDRRVFARAYVQWVATRTGPGVIWKAINGEPRNVGNIPEFWGSDDFEAVSDALDALFEDLGLLRKEIVPNAPKDLRPGSTAKRAGVPAPSPAFREDPAFPARSAEDEVASQSQTTYDVVLTSSGPRKVDVIVAVRAIAGLGLREAKDLVDRGSGVVLSNASKSNAESAKARIESVGARVELR
ncbi:MAG TPA: ribosomal protein L7/L12 [Acidimicrobiia bacterium]|nr:ribosomal protein L7/L12 [Acidimicrobiia bacterium]